MRKNFQKIMLMSLLTFLSSCKPATLIPIPTPSVITTATEIPRWVQYENALSNAILGSEGGLCEWTICGVSDSKREVYMWAWCQFRGIESQAGSAPAVIYLDNNGDILKVVIPRDGGYYAEDIHILFPPDVQARIRTAELDLSEAEKNMNLRRTEEALPLIVASGTPMP